jgi:hypothetical protein
MPADINKSVSVKFDADVSKLLNDVKGLSGLSEKEAKAVGKALSTNMKAAGKSAEVAAKKTQKSMKRMEKSSKGADRAFRQLKRRSSEIGRGFGELSMIIGDTDGPLGQMTNNISGIAMTAGALVPLFGALRGAMISLGASTAMATGGLSLVAGALALMVANMGGVDEETEKHQNKINRLGKAYRKLNDKIQKSIIKNAEFRDALKATIFQIDSLEREFREKQFKLDYELGKISKKDFEDFMLESAISAENERIEKSFENRAAGLQKSATAERNTLNDTRMALETLAEKQIIANRENAHFGMARIDVEKIHKLISATTKQSDIESLITKQFSHRNKIFRDNLRDYALQLKLVKAADNENKEFTKNRVNDQNKLKDIARQTAEGQIKLDNQKAAGSDREKNNQKTEQENEKRLIEIAKQRLSIDTQIQKLSTEKLSTDEQKIVAVEQQLEKVYELIQRNQEIAKNENELIDATKIINNLLNKRSAIQKTIAATIEDQKLSEKTEDEITVLKELFSEQKLGYEELSDLRMKYEGSFIAGEQKIHKEVMKMIEERNAKTKEGIQTTISLMGSFGGAMIETLDNVGVQNQVLVNNLFMLQRAAAVAQIAFSTAENITKAQGYPAPLNAIASGLAVATGVAQTAVVMSQPAPSSKKHMGGTIGPDERNYTLLRGEAVLDRQTVRNIGGAEGVRKLQQNQTRPEVVVLQPFKHFDRFLKSRNRKNGKSIKQGY